jgi:hypothetical protein
MKTVILAGLAWVALVAAVNAPPPLTTVEASTVVSEQQDTTFRAIRLMWADQAAAARLIIIGPDTTAVPYDSVRYQVQIRSPDLIVFDSIFADTVYVWEAGTFGQPYSASGIACGYLGTEMSCTQPGDSLVISYPYPIVTETTLAPMTITADTVEIQR